MTPGDKEQALFHLRDAVGRKLYHDTIAPNRTYSDFDSKFAQAVNAMDFLKLAETATKKAVKK